MGPIGGSLRQVPTVGGDLQARKDCQYIFGEYYLIGRDCILRYGFLPIICGVEEILKEKINALKTL